jgi:hypothetical protein
MTIYAIYDLEKSSSTFFEKASSASGIVAAGGMGIGGVVGAVSGAGLVLVGGAVLITAVPFAFFVGPLAAAASISCVFVGVMMVLPVGVYGGAIIGATTGMIIGALIGMVPLVLISAPLVIADATVKASTRDRYEGDKLDTLMVSVREQIDTLPILDRLLMVRLIIKAYTDLVQWKSDSSKKLYNYLLGENTLNEKIEAIKTYMLKISSGDSTIYKNNGKKLFNISAHYLEEAIAR